MQARRFLFILGRNPALSSAEVTSVFGPSVEHPTPGTALVTLDATAEEVARLYRRLGGSLKVGAVDCTSSLATLDEIFKREIVGVLESVDQEKVHLGVSVYGSFSEAEKISKRILRILLASKVGARERGQSVRIVTSRERTLSAVVVSKNHLLDRGREFLIVLKSGEIDQRSNLGEERFDLNHSTAFGRGGTSTNSILAHTIAVQDFEEQSRRDYGRPRRDPKRGILPLQLARIMVNLAVPHLEAKPPSTILDPFCGIGTILQEALLLGHDVIGSDIDPKAVEDTRVNLEWLDSRITNYELRITNPPQLLVSDIRTLPLKLHGRTVDIIVTELDLGPPIRGALTVSRVDEIRRSLLPLYRDAFAAFAQILKPGARLVVALPAWPLGPERSRRTTFVVDDLNTLIGPQFQLLVIPPQRDPALAVASYQLPHRHTFLYGRPDQHVWREVVVCERKLA